MDEIMVSIMCSTYNHERYIADALEGFIMQKTNFKYEVLVHDDASTDRTADIIREYEKKYPDIIKPVYQTENQYSKGIKGLIGRIQLKRARGKYAALCEGDDYWTCDTKLQEQVDFMESHPEYSLCVHTAAWVKADTKEVTNRSLVMDEDRDLSVEEIILIEGENMATNSMLYRIELKRNYPDLFLQNPVGDYPLSIYLSLCGRVRCIAKEMSAYRVMAKGSWSERNMADNVQAYRNRVKVLDALSDFLRKLDDYTKGRYHGAIVEKIGKFEWEIINKLYKCRDTKDFLHRLWRSDLTFDQKINYNQSYVKMRIKDFLKRGQQYKWKRKA